MMEVDMRFGEFVDLPELKDLIITGDGCNGEVLREGKWVSGQFDRNVRIDPPSHVVGQTHAHVLDRKGEEVGQIPKFTPSRSKCCYPVRDADVGSVPCSTTNGLPKEA